MTVVDGVILAVVVISGLLSLRRGFIHETFSLLNWFLALVATLYLNDTVADLLENYIASPIFRQISAYCAVFIVALLMGSFISKSLSGTIRLSLLSGVDKFFGFLFGIARGGVLLAVAVYGLRMTAFSDSNWWHQSELIPHIESLEVWLSRETSEIETSEIKAFLNRPLLK